VQARGGVHDPQLSGWRVPVKGVAIGFFRVIALLLAAAGIGSACASAADFKDFHDWYAACDNLRNCTAYGFAPQEPASAYVRVDRGGAPSNSARITIVATVMDGQKVTLAFDDAELRGLPSGPVTFKGGGSDPYGRFVIEDRAAVEAVFASVRKAQMLLVTPIGHPGGEKSDTDISEVSMRGAVAALLWIDEQQQRLGTPTALVRRGDRPVSSIPPQPKVPLVRAARPAAAAGAPKPLPPNVDSALLAKAKELCGQDEQTRLEEVIPLGPDTSLRAYTCPENSGAYNLTSVFLIVPDANPGAARAVELTHPIKIGRLRADPGNAPLAINAGFDPSTMTLSSFNKGRGIADCGTAEDWVWDGQAFRLTSLRYMPRCFGVLDEDWPVLYRAERK
jgi:Protein of unknown function (DUF1176)